MMQYDPRTQTWTTTPADSLTQQLCDQLDVVYREWSWYHEHDGADSERKHRLDAHMTELEQLLEWY